MRALHRLGQASRARRSQVGAILWHLGDTTMLLANRALALCLGLA